MRLFTTANQNTLPVSEKTSVDIFIKFIQNSILLAFKIIMSLNILQKSIVHGALVLSALTGCSAVPRDINHGRAAVVEDVDSPKNIEKRRKTLRKRIIAALEGLFSNYDKLNEREFQIAQDLENEKDPKINAYNRKRVSDCSTKSGGAQTVAFREQMFEVVRQVQDELSRCSALPREDKIECSADTVMKTGLGLEYVEAVEGLSASASQHIECLDLTAPRKKF